MMDPLVAAVGAWILALVLAVPAFRSGRARIFALSAAFVLPMAFGCWLVVSNPSASQDLVTGLSLVLSYVLMYLLLLLSTFSLFSGASSPGKSARILKFVHAHPETDRTEILTVIGRVDFEAERAARLESSLLVRISTGSIELTRLGKTLVAFVGMVDAVTGESKVRSHL